MKRQWTWNAICDVCGFKYKAWQLKERWDGQMVCHLDWETRHPQDLIKIPKDDQSIPWARPEPPDVFVDVTYHAATADDTIPSGNFNTNNETYEEV